MATALFLVATVEILSSNLPLPLGMLSSLAWPCWWPFSWRCCMRTCAPYSPRTSPGPRSLLLIGTIVLIVLILTRLGLVVATALHQSFPHIPFSAMRAALPVPLGGVLLTVLFNSRLAFAGSLSLTILTGSCWTRRRPTSCSPSWAASSASSPWPVARSARPSSGPAGPSAWQTAYTLLAFALLDADTASLTADIVGGIVNGLVVAVLATGVLPLLEHPFGRTTVFTLLELSNLNAPILKHLVLAAPGTYHHSIMVGTLAEAAAEAVGANALLCRVGAYYHDIGKTRHPGYFIENHADAGTRHEKLAPSLAAPSSCPTSRRGSRSPESTVSPRSWWT